MEAEIIQRTGIPFLTIPAAGLHGVDLRALPGNLVKLVKGLLASVRILREHRPDALFFTGGYLATPMAVAGRRLPALLFVPDIEPGLALKFLSRFADRIAVSVQASVRFFNPRKNISVTGYPVRAELSEWSRNQAIHHFQLDPELPVLLVFGGSKGARSINRALLNHLTRFLEKMQIIHISGSLDWELVKTKAAALPSNLSRRYHPFPYLHEMGAAYAAADLAVSRAGASTLGEYPQFGLPAILVPYPHAWRYQKINAEYLAQHGAAQILPDDQLADRLPDLIQQLIESPGKLRNMHNAMHALAQSGSAERIADQLLDLAGSRR